MNEEQIKKLMLCASELVNAEGVPALSVCRGLVMAAVSIYKQHHCDDQCAAATHLAELINEVGAAAIYRNPSLTSVN